MAKWIFYRSLGGLALLSLVGCVGETTSTEQDSTATVSQAVETSNQPYFYLTCNATGWDLSDKNRLECVDSMCIDYALEYDVNEPWLVSGGDSCALVRTNEKNSWGTEHTRYGSFVEGPAPIIGQLEVPSLARLYGDSQFTVKYPTAGRYRVWVTRARAAFTISPVSPTP